MTPFHRIVPGVSGERLDRLIEQRLAPGADKAAVDRRIWELFGERWAVVYTDLTGFSRHVSDFGVIDFLQTIYELNDLLMPHVERHGGLLLKPEGDSMLLIFRKPDAAIRCAVDFQRSAQDYNRRAGRKAETLLLCVGIGYGNVLRIGDSDVFGAEVNAACKLGEDQAKSREILVTGAVRNAVPALPGVDYEPLATVPSGADSAFKLIYAL